ncbi:hypothetical protein ACFU53_46475, partial [Streptomyces sp. NPDC057474]|uniref:hypothetical protein n=1 Tax=Streptomyces sp. NPDC057474 TaxID=3346144 RepID=UPI00369232E8
MRKITRKRSSTVRALQRGAVPLLVAGLLVGSGTAATAATHTAAATAHAGQDKVITLPGASSAEG